MAMAASARHRKVSIFKTEVSPQRHASPFAGIFTSSKRQGEQFNAFPISSAVKENN
jgi:hypothetical protein